MTQQSGPDYVTRVMSIGLPVFVVALYVVVVGFFVPENRLPKFHSETGPVEIVTALVLVVAGVFAAMTLAKLFRERASVPKRYIAWYALFTLGVIVIFLEETSYGQHYLGFASPEYFEANNKQSEMNLHNLYGDKPSSTLRRIANTGLPLFCIAAPALVMHFRKEDYQRGGWAWFIMPRWELVLWVILAALISPIRKMGGFSDGDSPWRGSLSEFKEMLWAFVFVVYGVAMWRRLREGAKALDAAEQAPAEATQDA